MPFVLNDGDYKLLYLGSEDTRNSDTENRFTLEWCADIEQLLSQLELSIDLGEKFGLIITADGKFFSNGLDIEVALGSPKTFPDYIDRVDAIYARILLLGVPTVSAINGHAFGAGAMLALCTDFSVMRTQRGYFSLPEAALNMHFPLPMMSLLKETLPPATVREATLTSYRYDSARAVQKQIVTAQADIEDLIDAAKSMIVSSILFSGSNYRNIKLELYGDLNSELNQPVPRDFVTSDLLK